MHPLAVVGLIVVGSVCFAGLITLRAHVYRYTGDAAGRRRCFIAWFLATAAEGGILWALGTEILESHPEWVLFAIALPLLPPTVLQFRDYPAPDFAMLGQVAVSAGLAIVAATGVTLLRPHIGEWSWSAPVAVAVAAFYWFALRGNSAKDNLIVLSILASLVILVVIIGYLLEWFGIAV